MGHEHEIYRKTVLGRPDEIGRAQEAFLADQRRQEEQEQLKDDKKSAELEEAREAAEARAQSQAGAQVPGGLTLRDAGFERDTLAEEIEKIARRYLSLSKTAAMRMQNAAAAQRETSGFSHPSC